jgi:hypothetical protein
MKKTGILLAAMTLGFCACVNNDVNPVENDKDLEITYTLSPVKVSTRANTTAFDSNETFGSSAYLLAKGKKWEINSSESSIFIDKEEISYNKDEKKWKAWDSGKSYYWRKDGSSLTFLSWHPYKMINNGLSISTTTGDFAYTGWTMENTAGYGYTYDETNSTFVRNTTDGSVDLLLAKTADKTANDSPNGVRTDFVHQLCNVRVYASLLDDPGEKAYKIIKAELLNVYTKADLAKAATTEVKTGVWDNYSEKADYTYTPTTSIELEAPTVDGDKTIAIEKVIFPQTLMLPQSVLTTSTDSPSVCIKVTYINEDNEELTVSGPLASNAVTHLTAWQPGKTIAYHIYIYSKEEYIEFDASTEEWKDGDETDIIVES